MNYNVVLKAKGYMVSRKYTFIIKYDYVKQNLLSMNSKQEEK